MMRANDKDRDRIAIRIPGYKQRVQGGRGLVGGTVFDPAPLPMVRQPHTPGVHSSPWPGEIFR